MLKSEVKELYLASLLGALHGNGLKEGMLTQQYAADAYRVANRLTNLILEEKEKQDGPDCYSR